MEESRFQHILNRIGLICFLIFFGISTVMVIRNSSRSGGLFPSDVKRLTFAHWQLEDGFREGYADAIRVYEKLKADQGINVKVVQTAVPSRGYAQWFLTQLIGGDCADVIELSGSQELQNQYFLPLSKYLAEENPYNRGTPLEGMAWRDTFADDMAGALSPTYSEYFGVSTLMCTTRMFETAGNSRRMAGFLRKNPCVRRPDRQTADSNRRPRIHQGDHQSDLRPFQQPHQCGLQRFSFRL